MSYEIAIADTSFLIDWSRYSKRDLLFEVVSLVFVPEMVIAEVKRDPTLSWASSSIARGRIPSSPRYQTTES